MYERFASHYIYYNGKIYPLHYIEIDDSGCIKGVHPLMEEIAGTVFCNGFIIVVPKPISEEKLRTSWSVLQNVYSYTDLGEILIKEKFFLLASPAEQIILYQLKHSSSEFSTCNGCSNGDIQRFGSFSIQRIVWNK